MGDTSTTGIVHWFCLWSVTAVAPLKSPFTALAPLSLVGAPALEGHPLQPVCREAVSFDSSVFVCFCDRQYRRPAPADVRRGSRRSRLARRRQHDVTPVDEPLHALDLVDHLVSWRQPYPRRRKRVPAVRALSRGVRSSSVRYMVVHWIHTRCGQSRRGGQSSCKSMRSLIFRPAEPAPRVRRSSRRSGSSGKRRS